MSMPQMSEMLTGLGKLETAYENMSGICATLRGLILVEAKQRLEHGRFMPFVKEHFAKNHRSATRYMKIAEAFLESRQAVQFDQLAQVLGEGAKALRDFSLDLKHPVVAKVAQWVEGRGAYQLMLDFPGDQGGDRAGSKAKKKTPAELHREYLENCKTDFCETFDSLDGLTERNVLMAKSITDAMIESSIDSAAEYMKKARAWLKVPQSERKAQATAIEQEARQQ
jgi:hypothetical protein